MDRKQMSFGDAFTSLLDEGSTIIIGCSYIYELSPSLYDRAP
jgi:hypothetical protein